MTVSGASTPSTTTPEATIVLLGRPCDNTSAVAVVLDDLGIDLTAVILAATGKDLNRTPGDDRQIRVHRSPSPRTTRRLLEHLQPDLVIAACYPWRLSQRARAASRCGVMNIHPSPLPHGRGPDPVFWIYRLGERETGVTVHLMDDGLDSGPILAQSRVAVPDQSNALSLERHLFETGATLAAGLVPKVLAGNATSSPQDEMAARYQPAPQAHDWIISPLLPAAWAWRFVQGVAPLQGPLAVQTQGRLKPVQRAIAWGEHGAPPAALPAGAFVVQFRPGWVVFE